VNSLLIAGLAVVDVYYLHEDVLLLATLAGAKAPVVEAVPTDHHAAILALGCVVAVWAARRFWFRK
jgi:hypothetical protein